MKRDKDLGRLDDEPTAPKAREHPAVPPSRLVRGLKAAGAALVFLALAAAAVRVGVGVYQRADASARASQAQRAYRDESVGALRSAATPDELERAVDPDGVVLEPRDGSWIAIRSSAAPAGGQALNAVARDSGGAWFESTRPFHLQLSHYRIWQEPRARARSAHDTDWSEEKFLALGINRQLDAVEQSADLAQARQRLQTLGFREFRP